MNAKRFFCGVLSVALSDTHYNSLNLSVAESSTFNGHKLTRCTFHEWLHCSLFSPLPVAVVSLNSGPIPELVFPTSHLYAKRENMGSRLKYTGVPLKVLEKCAVMVKVLGRYNK